MVLGHAPQHQVAGVLPVRLAELPEAAAERVQPAGRHVDRAESAVRGVVDRAELLRPPAGERLRLVAAGEERELVGIARADRRSQLAASASASSHSISRNSPVPRSPTRSSGLCSRAGE